MRPMPGRKGATVRAWRDQFALLSPYHRAKNQVGGSLRKCPLVKMPYPDLEQVRLDFKSAKKILRELEVPSKLITSIETKALRTGRKVTGEHATNRQSRWMVKEESPQYATEIDCRIIFIILCAMIFEFQNAPELTKAASILRSASPRTPSAPEPTPCSISRTSRDRTSTTS